MLLCFWLGLLFSASHLGKMTFFLLACAQRGCVLQMGTARSELSEAIRKFEFEKLICRTRLSAGQTAE